MWPVGDRFEDNTGAISRLWQTLIALVSLRLSFELRCVHRDERCNSRRTLLDHYPSMQWQATHVHRHHPLKQKSLLTYAAGRFGLDRLGKYSIIRRPATNCAPETAPTKYTKKKTGCTEGPVEPARCITASMVRPLARAVPLAIVPVVAIVPMMPVVSVVAVMRILDEAYRAAVDTSLGHRH
jgi:hypothetical protein